VTIVEVAARRHAFTLIEVLVVIAMIAIRRGKETLSSC